MWPLVVIGLLILSFTMLGFFGTVALVFFLISIAYLAHLN
jgi:hypothetical protein